MMGKLLFTGAAVVILGVAVVGSVRALGPAATLAATRTELPPATARVTRTTLVETRRVSGTLRYGDPLPVSVPGNGTLTWIAPVGSTVQRGEPLFKVGVDSTRGANLAFSATGRLAEIDVAVGDRVTAGQVLARLSAEALEAKLEQAGSQLATAQLSSTTSRRDQPRPICSPRRPR